jgi:hypothetical protein
VSGMTGTPKVRQILRIRTPSRKRAVGFSERFPSLSTLVLTRARPALPRSLRRSPPEQLARHSPFRNEPAAPAFSLAGGLVSRAKVTLTG